MGVLQFNTAKDALFKDIVADLSHPVTRRTNKNTGRVDYKFLHKEAKPLLIIAYREFSR